MKKTFLLTTAFVINLSLSNAQSNNAGNRDNQWKFNTGLDIGAWWGGTGLSSIKQASNPLLSSNLTSQVAYSGDIYFEWLHKKKLTNKIGPGFGIKTKLVWDYFTANNAQSGNSYESVTLNYANVPVLFEYCLSFKNKVTSAHYTPATSNTTTTVIDHGYYANEYSYTNTTPGGYYAGGVPFSDAIFIYGGPQIAYLTKGYHNVNGISNVINDPNFRNSYAGVIGGFCFYLNHINLDISYQRGLTSIYSGKNLYINGFLFKAGFNLSKRKFPG
jgi:hypothetical protein